MAAGTFPPVTGYRAGGPHGLKAGEWTDDTSMALALARFKKTKDANTSGDSSEHAAGNGSIMRLAPVPIRYADLFPDRLVELVHILDGLGRSAWEQIRLER